MSKKAKKTKSPTRGKLIKKADSIFSTYIRLRDSNSKGIVVCPLCGAKVPRRKAQNMHFISRSCMLYRYDELNCFAGCMRCNVILNGNYIVYTRFMQDKFGIDKVDEMISNSKKIYKLQTFEIEDIINTYTEKIKKYAKLTF